MENIRITDAKPEDSYLIADAILAAVGEEIVSSIAGDKTREDVRNIFNSLAKREDSQYSYLNTRIAVTDQGEKTGVCISYDGGKLLELRRSFFQEAIRKLGWSLTEEEIDSLPGETSKEEFYLDTLATLPNFRNRGVATALIKDAKKKAQKKNLPLGLLVADHNPNARKLYDALGFRPVGRRFFASEEMTNLRLID